MLLLGTNHSNPIGDNRFAAMFQDKDFEVDFESNEYKLLNPSSKGGPNGNGGASAPILFAHGG